MVKKSNRKHEQRNFHESSRPNKQRRGCHKKVKFGGKQAAEKKIAEMQQTGDARLVAARLQAYECKECGHWHIGHDIRHKDWLSVTPTFESIAALAIGPTSRSSD